MTDFESDNLIDESVAQYLENFAGDSPEPAFRMEEEARERDFPIVGPVVGRFLSLVSGAIDPDEIFELGSGFGYSAYWFARGTDACIHLTDRKHENLYRARAYLEDPFDPYRFEYHTGDALESLRSTDGTFDLLFVDLDKEQYPDVLDLAPETLLDSGWLIADNVLWRGRVTGGEDVDESTRALKTFNERLRDGPWNASILSVRDGLAVARRTE
jgi:predicted O-methyltransferase YrrM